MNLFCLLLCNEVEKEREIFFLLLLFTFSNADFNAIIMRILRHSKREEEEEGLKKEKYLNDFQ
jgi:hypothetical protein